MIAYHRNGTLKLVEFDGSVWRTSTVDSRGGSHFSLAITPDGSPAISYIRPLNFTHHVNYAVRRPIADP